MIWRTSRANVKDDSIANASPDGGIKTSWTDACGTRKFSDDGAAWHIRARHQSNSRHINNVRKSALSGKKNVRPNICQGNILPRWQMTQVFIYWNQTRFDVFEKFTRPRRAGSSINMGGYFIIYYLKITVDLPQSFQCPPSTRWTFKLAYYCAISDGEEKTILESYNRRSWLYLELSVL